METIHTDAAYKALSRRNSGRFEDQMSLDQSVHHTERKMLIKVNDGDEIHDINPEVIVCTLPLCSHLLALIYI